MRLSIAAWLLFTDAGVLLPRSEVSPKSPTTSNVSGCVELTLAGSRVVKVPYGCEAGSRSTAVSPEPNTS
jgi:hypothetical protein